MAQTHGFGRWSILDKQGGINRAVYGIVDIGKMLFIETDSNQNPVGKVLNLNQFGGWELVIEEKEDCI